MVALFPPSLVPAGSPVPSLRAPPGRFVVAHRAVSPCSCWVATSCWGRAFSAHPRRRLWARASNLTTWSSGSPNFALSTSSGFYHEATRRLLRLLDFDTSCTRPHALTSRLACSAAHLGMPACTQLVSLATQSRNTRSRADSACASSAGRISFAVAFPSIWPLGARAPSRAPLEAL
jgi:hypothetical protein